MFVQAKHFTNASRGVGDIRRIVVHTAEIQEHRDSAEDVAEFFRTTTKEVSAHKCVDNNTIVDCVRLEDIAFHAKGDNEGTVGYELSGFAKQTRAQWRDAYSLDVIELFCQDAAKLCKIHDIPMRWLTADQERRRVKGFVTHKIVSQVFGAGIRSDPGPNFPFDLVEKRVKELLAPSSANLVYVILDESGQVSLATSATAKNTMPSRLHRLETFFTNQLVLIDKELQEDNDIVIRRRRVT
jgi:N-acetyl-anhydromuramyl-L-alanine amidase AmpD